MTDYATLLRDQVTLTCRSVDRFLNRCSDEEMTELLAAFQEAAARRAARSGS